MYDIIIIGGGLAGLTNSILLARQGLKVKLLERKAYPFHRVCGEYISNEVRDFLIREDLFPQKFAPPEIDRFQLTSANGKSAIIKLGLGGFGISRYAMDHFLAGKARESGVMISERTLADGIEFSDEKFTVKSGNTAFECRILIGAFGKRSRLDGFLNRSFIHRPSPYLGVKYHIKYDTPDDLISLHNFPGGYCGISNVEEGIVNLCYLSERRNLKDHGEIKTMETQVLGNNPYLKKIFRNAEFVFDDPVVINEISFETKEPVENHIFMCGDAAGMITPLCGNGMAIAIHSAFVLSSLLLEFFKGKIDRSQLERMYRKKWSELFRNRLWAGRQIQKLFGSTEASNLAVNIASNLRPVARYLVNKTHGTTF